MNLYLLYLYKILLLIIPFLFGCAREYQCCLPELTAAEEAWCGPIYTVDWPKGEKEAEEQCSEDYPEWEHMGMDEYGEPTGMQTCECEKAD